MINEIPGISRTYESIKLSMLLRLNSIEKSDSWNGLITNPVTNFMHVPAPSSHPEIVVSYFLKQLSSASNYLIYIKLDEAIKII